MKEKKIENENTIIIKCNKNCANLYMINTYKCK